jgi:formylglycine-generating enzyme required for sulfatase activity
VAEWVADGGAFYPPLPSFTDATVPLEASSPDRFSDGAIDVLDATEDTPERTESGLYVLDGWRGRDDVPWRVVRGGDDAIPMGRRTTTLRRFRQPSDRLPWVGFRCAY